MGRNFFNLKYVFLILSLILIFTGAVFAGDIKGDINNDGTIDLADAISHI